ncbi:MAG: ribosomal L7Ae/L30e/S12e/Gadd45 family protein [Candidatus Woesearchaeota archaeon]|nr:ribosomal L7Ae/L30e/S12e/Gadd45 family protein [Candidatus Woesearchaeota archaeon]
MKAEIRKLLGTEKLVIGTERVMQELRAGALQQVVVASNCDERVLEDINHYAGDTAVVQLDVPNEELGVYCKKPFHVQTLGIRA